MGKPSQRKGRAGEHEVRDCALAYDLPARTHGIYEPLDVTIDGEPYEVKRRASVFKDSYNAMHAGAAGIIYRADRERWMVAEPLEDWLARKERLKALEAAINKEESCPTPPLTAQVDSQ